MPPRKKTAIEQTVSPLAAETKTAKKEITQIASLENLRLQVSREINNLFDLLVAQINKVELLKGKIIEEQELKTRQQKQTEEEQNLNLNLSLRKKQAEFNEEIDQEKKDFEEYKKQKEAEIKTQKEELNIKGDELKNFKMLVESFPQKLEKAVLEARKQVTIELQKEFSNEQKLQIQKSESDLRLLQQQISSLQQSVKQQEREMQSLKDEKNKAIDQVKELAIAVVKGKEKELSPQPNST